MTTRDEIEYTIIEKVETERGFVKGDFMIAVVLFWQCAKYFMSQKEMPTIRVPYWGTFLPEYKNVNMAAKRELKRIIAAKGTRSRYELYKILVVRRRLIEAGEANRMYYYRKMFRNGRRRVGDEKDYKKYIALKEKLKYLEDNH